MSNKIYNVIPVIIGSIGAIGKTKKNQQQGYSFRGVDDVYAALSDKLAEHGVTIVPVLKDILRDKFTTKNGTAMFQVSATVEYHIYADDGSNIVACVAGEAMDSGDKATPKALSMAYKYMAFQVFCIPTDEKIDTEHDSPQVTLSAPATLSQPTTPKAAPRAKQAPKPATKEAEVQEHATLLEKVYKLIPESKRADVNVFLQGFTWTDGTKRTWLLPNEVLADLPLDKLRGLVNHWPTFQDLLEKWILAKDEVPGAEAPPNVNREPKVA